MRTFGQIGTNHFREILTFTQPKKRTKFWPFFRPEISIKLSMTENFWTFFFFYCFRGALFYMKKIQSIKTKENTSLSLLESVEPPLLFEYPRGAEESGSFQLDQILIALEQNDRQFWHEITVTKLQDKNSGFSVERTTLTFWVRF